MLLLLSSLCFFTDVPEAPLNVIVGNVSKFGCTVSWETPESDGGSPITSYIIELRDRTSVKWSPVQVTKADELSAIINDVIENKEYIFRVKAENKAGVGKPSAASGPVKIMDPIGETKNTRIDKLNILLGVTSFIQNKTPHELMRPFIFGPFRVSQSSSEPFLARPEQELGAARLGDSSEERREHDHRLHHRTLCGRHRQVAALQRPPLPRPLLQGTDIHSASSWFAVSCQMCNGRNL